MLSATKKATDFVRLLPNGARLREKVISGLSTRHSLLDIKGTSRPGAMKEGEPRASSREVGLIYYEPLRTGSKENVI